MLTGEGVAKFLGGLGFQVAVTTNSLTIRKLMWNSAFSFAPQTGFEAGSQPGSHNELSAHWQ